MIKCPYCGKSYYKESFSSTTCMYFPPIYKNGVNINPDGNISTTVCECLECGKTFSYSMRYGKVIEENKDE